MLDGRWGRIGACSRGHQPPPQGHHPAHQQHYQQIQQQLSEQGRQFSVGNFNTNPSFTTPAAQRRVVDLPVPAFFSHQLAPSCTLSTTDITHHWYPGGASSAFVAIGLARSSFQIALKCEMSTRRWVKGFGRKRFKQMDKMCWPRSCVERNDGFKMDQLAR